MRSVIALGIGNRFVPSGIGVIVTERLFEIESCDRWSAYSNTIKTVPGLKPS